MNDFKKPSEDFLNILKLNTKISKTCKNKDAKMFY